MSTLLFPLSRVHYNAVSTNAIFFLFFFRKLDNNLEEAMADNSDDTVRHVIY